MNKVYLVAVLSSALLVGCGQPQAPTASPSATGIASVVATATATTNATTNAAALQVTLPGGADLTFEPTCGYFDPRGDIKSGTISVANYEFKMDPMAANSVAEIAKDGQIRIAIGLKSLPEGSYEIPITPGEYTAANISFVEVYSFENGSQKNSGFDNEKGKVIVTEVTDSKISGSVDVSGDNGAVLKGAFTAEKTRKS